VKRGHSPVTVSAAEIVACKTVPGCSSLYAVSWTLCELVAMTEVCAKFCQRTGERGERTEVRKAVLFHNEHFRLPENVSYLCQFLCVAFEMASPCVGKWCGGCLLLGGGESTKCLGVRGDVS
jgi:hypothetical protein